MKKPRGAALAAIVALLGLCAAAGRSAGANEKDDAPAAATACDEQPKDHVILVGSDKVSCKEPRLSKSKAHKITWRAAGGERIEVVFRSKDGVDPFPGFKCPGDSGLCKTDKIADGAAGRYEYDVWLYTADGKKLIDPAVIIDP